MLVCGTWLCDMWNVICDMSVCGYVVCGMWYVGMSVCGMWV
jgi:hypothetical protein